MLLVFMKSFHCSFLTSIIILYLPNNSQVANYLKGIIFNHLTCIDYHKKYEKIKNIQDVTEVQTLNFEVLSETHSSISIFQSSK